jgi:hypothetical protein
MAPGNLLITASKPQNGRANSLAGRLFRFDAANHGELPHSCPIFAIIRNTQQALNLLSEALRPKRGETGAF